MPTVTVITPTYNRCNLLVDAINSVLAQSYKDFELLVIDDGSTDKTRQIISAINDSRIKYIYKDNGGVSSARNAGMAEANGRYIAFLDSDDTWPKDFLMIMTDKLEQNREFGVAYTATTFCSSEENNIVQPSYNIERCVSGSITTELFKNSFVWPMSVLIRRNVLKDFWFDEALRNSDDNDAFLRLSVRTKLLFVPDIEVTRFSSKDAHSKASYISGSCNRAMSLERFYFILGGDKIVPRPIALQKIGHVYRRAAERHRKGGYRRAAIKLFKQAMHYQPFDLRLYIGLFKVLLISKAKDKEPRWSLPKPLGMPVCHLLPTEDRGLIQE
jgi:glycosyltransferase involved in cell wall biosynthesis